MNQPKRSKYNPNHILCYGSRYKGFDMWKQNAPYIEQYLDKLYEVFQRSFYNHPRTLVVCFDLHLPFYSQHSLVRNPITEFIENIKRGIKSYQLKQQREKKRIHHTQIEYVAKVEQTIESPLEHYHVVLFLNKDTFYNVGNLSHEDRTQLGRIIRHAWLKVHGISTDSTAALLHASNPVSYSLEGPLTCLNKQHEVVFKRISYLCKEATTKYQGRHQSFYSSNAKNKAPA
ncbi:MULTISPECIES: YagK/YfjJ domain-containing protein [Idiomarina]|uniref:YagK/YfjJ C-terminal domain-containing protein n=1 Tax=Idiomarina seosinensis TaxID=281739 RepID=A0A432ZIL5_9GAMM|nr:inovirus-type Gp2 protein [Idiomarina seosinensis]RUO77865.1 hypothetical protein CWI81_05125 [Idiomarina seosinensis]